MELQRNPPPNTDPGVRIFTIRGLPQQIELARHLIDEKVGVSVYGHLLLYTALLGLHGRRFIYSAILFLVMRFGHSWVTCSF